jgi:hypothetical protein
MFDQNKVAHIFNNKNTQVSLVIRGRYVPLFWTANTKFADKRTHFDSKLDLIDPYFICE